MTAQQTVYGIDLGTTYSCIAYVDEYGRPVIVVNAEGDNTTPSVVLFESATNIVVGKEAQNSAVAKPNNVVTLVKRQMGTDWHWNFAGTDYSPEEISSYILKKVVGDAETHLGTKITDVVITCPAYFGINEREATARAGKIAGLNVLEIINEPTAAAITYGLQDQENQVVMVYDLGGGTFDITIIEIKKQSLRVVATGGDHMLGGHDWDNAVVLWLAEQWMNETGSMDNPLNSLETEQDLWLKAESAKRSLTAKDETRVTISHAGQMATITLTRATFDQLTADLLNRTIQFTRDTMDIGRGLGAGHIDQLLLVGGSSKMPQVAARLISEFHMEPKLFDPDQSVAKGAAIYGQQLAIGQRIKTELAERLNTTADKVDVASAPPELLKRVEADVASDMGRTTEYVRGTQEQRIINVISHSFGIIATDDSLPTWVDYVSNLVKRNAPIPTTVTKTYGIMQDNQSRIDLRIMENESDDDDMRDLSRAKEIGIYALDLPAGLRRGAPIEVTFAIDQQARLHLTGRDMTSYREVTGVIETNAGMSREEEAAAIKRAVGVKVS